MKTFENVKKVSEKYAKFMRTYFPLSFENYELNSLLLSCVYDSEKSLFVEELEKQNAVARFKTYIYSKINVEKEAVKETKSVKELLDSVGYDFYHCESVESVKELKKYYEKDEIICTFNNISSRLSHYNIFWIVKKDIKNIKRGSFANPTRQDLYGTSCCSIQIGKSNNSDISIKNRYNHKVNSCDATFSNNLENVCPGLTEAINIEYKLETSKSKNIEIDNFRFINNMFVYYFQEINNIYYGLNKCIKNGEVIEVDTSKELLVDIFTINIQEKTIKLIDTTITDSFSDLKFNKIEVYKGKKMEDYADEDGVLKIFLF